MKTAFFLLLNGLIAAFFILMPKEWGEGVEYLRHRVVFEYLERIADNSVLEEGWIIGDSRSECCLHPDGFINLSLGGATPLEGYFLLQHALERGIRPQKVILSYGPLHIATQDSFHGRTLYYALYPEGAISEASKQAQQLGDTGYQTIRWESWKRMEAQWIPDRLKFPLMHLASFDITNLWKMEPSAFAPPEDKLHRSGTYDRVNDAPRAKEYRYRHMPPSPVNMHYLHKIKALLSEHRIPHRYVFMPMNRDVKVPEPQWFEAIFDAISEAGFAECMNAPRFIANEYFFDPSHLNQKGLAWLKEHFDVNALPYCR